MTLYETLQEDVEAYGEAHVTMEQHDEELEIRHGQVRWGDTTFSIITHGRMHVFSVDRIVDYYLPEEIWH